MVEDFKSPIIEDIHCVKLDTEDVPMRHVRQAAYEIVVLYVPTRHKKQALDSLTYVPGGH